MDYKKCKFYTKAVSTTMNSGDETAKTPYERARTVRTLFYFEKRFLILREGPASLRVE
jgi:hypothetical protein